MAHKILALNVVSPSCERPVDFRFLASKIMRGYGLLTQKLRGLKIDLMVPKPGETPVVLRPNFPRYQHGFNAQLLLALLTMLGHRSMIFYGEPGTGKTTTFLLLERLFGLEKDAL